MKRIIGLMVFLALMAGLIFIADDVFAARRKKDNKAEAEETAQTPEPELIYTFKNAEEMGQFEQLYVSKQATFGRMGVLQAYFAMEQNNLTAIDNQMQESFGFKMDPSKMYDLNRDTLEIRELGPVTPPVAQ